MGLLALKVLRANEQRDMLGLMALKVLRALPGHLDRTAIPFHKDLLGPLAQPDPQEPG